MLRFFNSNSSRAKFLRIPTDIFRDGEPSLKLLVLLSRLWISLSTQVSLELVCCDTNLNESTADKYSDIDISWVFLFGQIKQRSHADSQALSHRRIEKGTRFFVNLGIKMRILQDNSDRVIKFSEPSETGFCKICKYFCDLLDYLSNLLAVQ